MFAFLNEFISATLGIDPTLGGIEMDRAHRIGTRLGAGDKNHGQTIVALLLRYKDCQAILEAAQEKKHLMWNGKQVMIFPDYSRETQRKREAFSRCKKALHERKIKFGMLYPAILKLFISGLSPRVFDDPRSAEVGLHVWHCVSVSCDPGAHWICFGNHKNWMSICSGR